MKNLTGLRYRFFRQDFLVDILEQLNKQLAYR